MYKHCKYYTVANYILFPNICKDLHVLHCNYSDGNIMISQYFSSPTNNIIVARGNVQIIDWISDFNFSHFNSLMCDQSKQATMAKSADKIQFKVQTE